LIYKPSALNASPLFEAAEASSKMPETPSPKLRRFKHNPTSAALTHADIIFLVCGLSGCIVKKNPLKARAREGQKLFL
jgi:hypothetical protein